MLNKVDIENNIKWKRGGFQEFPFPESRAPTGQILEVGVERPGLAGPGGVPESRLWGLSNEPPAEILPYDPFACLDLIPEDKIEHHNTEDEEGV